MSINTVAISGNLTRDAELRSTQSGMAVLGFSVAVNERVKNPQSGEYEDRPNFIDCTMFGTRAERVAQYLTKGAKVSVQGRLHWSQWKQNDGTNRSKIEVVVDELELPAKAAQQAPAHQPPMQQAPQYYQQQYQPQPPQAHQQAQQYQQPPMQPPMQQSMYDADIPF